MGIPADVQLPEMLVSVAAEELCRSEPDAGCHEGYSTLTGACTTCRRRARTVGRELYDAGQARTAGSAPRSAASGMSAGAGGGEQRGWRPPAVRALPLLPETMSHIRAGAVAAARESGREVIPDSDIAVVRERRENHIDETYDAIRGESGRSHLRSSWSRWWRRETQHS